MCMDVIQFDLLQYAKTTFFGNPYNCNEQGLHTTIRSTYRATVTQGGLEITGGDTRPRVLFYQ